MDRRLFVTGLLGVAGTAGIAAVLPHRALAAVPMGPTPQPGSVLPDLEADEAGELEGLDALGELDGSGELDEGIELVSHVHRHRRRRVRRWRRRCRSYWVHGRWRRRCRRVPYWHFIWFWI